ncbi:MAG: B12-binding domain-containing radical SAM protein [Thermosulfidibacteraceae bacterium]|jgi:radical SAM superfamily enzyme YgiQ (UPF0313 family)
MPDILLVNPWVYDFACYDFWLKPFGLLKIGGILRSKGYSVLLYDFLNPYHPDVATSVKRQKYGTGHFYKIAIPKDFRLLDVPRKYYRYGLPYEVVIRDLSRMEKPKVILVNSGMTYWWVGLYATVEVLKKLFKDVPIVIGGIYVNLCYQHAIENFGDVIVFRGEIEELLELIGSLVAPSGPPSNISYPLFDQYERLEYVVIETSSGCPFRCSYCASKLLKPKFVEKDYREVFEELLYWHENYGVRNFAFYDDALLFNFENRLGPFLELVISKGLDVNFHTPNGIHTRYISREVAFLLRRAGFKTLKLGVERFSRRFDDKTSREEIVEAICYLKEAGFTKEEIGVYMIFGLPDEDFDYLVYDIHELDRMGVGVYLAEFSPVPGTPVFELAKVTSRYDLNEPLFHNNTIFPALKKPDWDKIQFIKNLVRRLRKS